ncbi:MAG TPA: hypothetical protein VIE88_05815 [Vicinamibacteria bacterium]|jgi:hypothetical protein
MNRKRHEHFDLDREAEIKTNETTQKLLQEIAEDARRLKNRYPKDTLVTEGGE